MSNLIEGTDCRLPSEDIKPTTTETTSLSYCNSDEQDIHHRQLDIPEGSDKVSTLLSKLFSIKAESQSPSRSTSTETVHDGDSQTLNVFNYQVNPHQPAEIIRKLKREQEKEHKKKQMEEKRVRKAAEKTHKHLQGGAAWGFDPGAGKKTSADAATSTCSTDAVIGTPPNGLRKRSQGTWGSEHGGPMHVIDRGKSLFRRTG